MKTKIFLMILSTLPLHADPNEESHALAKSLCGVGLIFSAYACHKTLNYIIRRDTRNLNEQITHEEAQPSRPRQFINHHQQEQDDITYLRYASKFMTSWLTSAGLFLLYQSQAEANQYPKY
jgi:hypothetical protein